MWQANTFRIIGWAILVSSVALMLFPWQWHQQFGARILPFFIQHMRWYAVGALAFGLIILYAVFSPQPEHAV
jgi:hypothetical protein